MTMRRLLGLAVLATLAAWPAFAQSPGAQSPDDWNAVIAAAKKEGTVTFYTGELGLACATPRMRDFEARYGIKVERLEGRATELDQRIISEQAAGKFTGDVEMNGGPGMSRAEAQGRLQPHGDLPNKARLLPQFKGDANWFDVEVLPYTILVNTDEVKPADMPTGWMDLINPNWKGNILSDDLRLLGVGVTPLDDPARAAKEIDLAIAAGCKAIWIPAAPAGG
jgi:iron(III) transport system substrate-binding protein